MNMILQRHRIDAIDSKDPTSPCWLQSNPVRWDPFSSKVVKACGSTNTLNFSRVKSPPDESDILD